jgi:preprotein translocase subunit SecY
MVSKPLYTKKNFSGPNKKLLTTLLMVLFYRLGNLIPLTGIDQEALKKAFLQAENKNAIMQILNMYSGTGGLNELVTVFSLGIIPFINASIVVDLLTALFPSLEKLQQEEGEAGRRTLNFYKKILSLIFAIIQTTIVINYIKPYLYNTGFYSMFSIGITLVAGAMLVIWISNQIETKGVGNGTSIIILLNILANLPSRDSLFNTIGPESSVELVFLFFISGLILITQTARFEIPIVSARQLSFTNDMEKNNVLEAKVRDQFIQKNSLNIRLSQAGIFPIIIAANILPFLSYLVGGFVPKVIINVFYYFLIVIFNFFYTTIFWDPAKIAEQLRKSSVSITGTTPGKPTEEFLSRKVEAVSLAGGVFLCGILILYDSFKFIRQTTLLNQLNISSLMIVIGVTYELQKTIRAMYKNVIVIEKETII